MRATLDREQLARDYLPLAERRARKVGLEQGLPVDEAQSAALLGLAEAIDRYQPGRGEFAPFACRTIDGRVKEAAREWRWQRQANYLDGRELVSDEQLTQQLPDTLTAAELSDARSDILIALRALYPLERQIVLLHGKLGHSISSVAVALGLDEQHARYLWRRALGKMRAELVAA